MLQTALNLAERGLKVLPIWKPAKEGGCSCPLGTDCPSPGKHPITARGVQDASQDPTKIREWFSTGRYNLGVTGHTTFLIVDFDDSAAYFDWIREQKELSATLTAISGSGRGYHVYIKLEEGTSIANYNHKYGEVRGRNQYVVAPPSVHAKGGEYKWVNPDAPILVAKPSQLPQRKGEAVTVNMGDVVFGDKPVDEGALLRHMNDLNPFALQHVMNPTGDRSGGDWALIRDLLRLGATNHEIWSIFESYPCGRDGKYATKGKRDRINYLRLTIAKAREELNQDMVQFAESKEGSAVIGLGVSQEVAMKLTEFSPDDDGNARAFIQMFPHKFIYTQSFGWMKYNGRYWQRDGAEAELQRNVIDLFNTRRALASQLPEEAEAKMKALFKASARTATNRNNVIQMIQSYLWDATIRFDNHKELLNAHNGTIELRTGKLIPHSYKHYFTYALDVDYKPEAVSEEWERFVAECLENPAEGIQGEKLEDLLEWVQKAIGYTISGETSEELLFYVHGASRSGKGVFTNTLSRVLGQPLALATDFKTFTDEKGDPNGYKIAPLRNTRMVVASESSTHDWLNSEITKRITGRDQLQARYLYQDFFYFHPQWTIWLFSNFPVKGDPDDHALWGRVRVLYFPTSHLGREDKGLKNRLEGKRNLEGVLAWAVEGAVKWYALGDRGLDYPEYVRKLTEAHREDVDYIGKWFTDSVKKEAGAFTPSDSLYQSYKGWCENENVRPKTKPNFIRILGNQGYEITRVYVGGRQVRGINGLRMTQQHKLEVVA